MLDKLCRQTVLSLQQHQTIVHFLPLLGSQPLHELAKISAKCYNPPFHVANIQKVSIYCNYIGKTFYTFNLLEIICFRLELQWPSDVNREATIFYELLRFLQQLNLFPFAVRSLLRLAEVCAR